MQRGRLQGERMEEVYYLLRRLKESMWEKSFVTNVTRWQKKKPLMIKPATKTVPSSSNEQNIRRNLFTEEISSNESDYIDDDWEAYMQEITVFSDEESGPSWNYEARPSWA